MRDLFAALIRATIEMIRVGLLRRSGREIFGFAAVAAACFAISAASDLIVEALDVGENVFRENGPIEMVQAWTVGLAGLLFYLAALRLDFELFYGGLMLSLASGLAVMREIPGCGSHFYDGGACLTDGRKGWLTILLLLAVLGLAVIRREPLARHLRELNFFWFVPCCYAFAFLVTAELMEKFQHTDFEETLELSGYLMLLAFSLALNLKPRWFDARNAPPLSLPKARRR